MAKPTPTPCALWAECPRCLYDFVQVPLGDGTFVCPSCGEDFTEPYQPRTLSVWVGGSLYGKLKAHAANHHHGDTGRAAQALMRSALSNSTTTGNSPE